MDRSYGSERGVRPRTGNFDDSQGGAANEARTNERANVTRSVPSRRIEQRLTVLPVRQPLSERSERVVIASQAGKIASRFGAYISFVLAVVVPMAIASVYYGWFASNQYVAEFRFAVKDTSITSSSIGSSIASMLGGSSGSAVLENYIVADYLTSRQATEELNQRINVRSFYERPEIDWWARFKPSEPMEKFVEYWQKMVTASYDMVTGIAVAQVRAFKAEDALLIANSLVTLSEELVNKIANRSNTDAVRFAEREVERAQDRLKNVRATLTAYRNKVGVIDPATSVVASNSTVQQTLQASLAGLETQLTSLLGRNLSPSSLSRNARGWSEWSKVQ